MKRVFDITFNGEESFQTEPMTKTAVIDLCWDTLIQNNMQDDGYLIGYFEGEEYTLIASVSRRRRANGRISCSIVNFTK